MIFWNNIDYDSINIDQCYLLIFVSYDYFICLLF